MNDRNSHTEGVVLSYKELITLRQCEDKLVFEQLHLHRKGDEQEECISSLFGFILADYKKTSSVKKTYMALLNRLDSDLKREWFEFDAQYALSRHYYAIAFKRMLSYLGEDISVVDTNVSASAHVMISYKKLCICDIIVTAPAILRRNGRTVVVLFEDGVNPFSDMAKKVSNHPSRSIALTCAYLAFAPIYGPNIDVETWYLGSKDDKNGCLSGKFESKPGKNIANFSFGDINTAFLSLREALAVAEEKNCNGCKQKDVCCFSREVCNYDSSNIFPVKKEALSKEQLKIVEHMDGALCCYAPSGTGKTTALAYRVKNLIEHHIEPSSILWFTTSDEETEEVKRKVRSILNTDDISRLPTIITAEKFAYVIMRDNPLLTGRRVKIADSLDRLILIKNAIATCPIVKNMSYSKAYLDFGLVRLFDQLFGEIKKDGKEAFLAKYESSFDVKGIFRVYEEFQKQMKDFFPYETIVETVNGFFEKHPSVLNKTAEKYRYLMMDNFQDVATETAAMIFSIAKRCGNVVVAGDPNQKICTWKSCVVKREFMNAFPCATDVKMDYSFRVNRQLNTDRNNISIDTFEAGAEIAYLKYASKHDLADVVLTALKNGYKPMDIAVLARTNSQLSEAQALLNGVVKTTGRKHLRVDTVFLLIYDVMTLFYRGMEDDVALYRYLSFYGDVEGKADVDRTLYENLTFKGKDISLRYGKAAEILQKCFECLRKNKSIPDTLRDLCGILIGIQTHLVIEQLIEKADRKAIINVRVLFNYMCSMIKFSDDARLYSGYSEGAIRLLTVHASKGKDFPITVVYGIENFEAQKEEAKLYVALTRAKDKTYLLESKNCEICVSSANVV